MSAPPGPTAQAAAVYISRVAGLCKGESANHDLLNLLKGMCIRRSVFDENEYGLEFPLQSGTNSGSFKMIKMVQTTGALIPLGPAPPTVWRLVHESVPLRGNPWNSLAASVLEVTESALTGIYAVQFMHGMGCQQKYRVQRRNNMFVCLHEGYEIQVCHVYVTTHVTYNVVSNVVCCYVCGLLCYHTCNMSFCCIFNLL
eukprot:GHUV01024805.1.p1 GENE.GHUV01024805.1~~GHUV01024805.1.p1  ORF type:complete len:199 (+),score=6.30 GHUV01024805.1:458-1054(+)